MGKNRLYHYRDPELWVLRATSALLSLYRKIRIELEADDTFGRLQLRIERLFELHQLINQIYYRSLPSRHPEDMGVIEVTLVFSHQERERMRELLPICYREVAIAAYILPGCILDSEKDSADDVNSIAEASNTLIWIEHDLLRADSSIQSIESE